MEFDDNTLCFDRMSYAEPWRAGRAGPPARQRDGAAGMEMHEQLRDAGYRFRDVLLNFPPPEDDDPNSPANATIEIDRSRFKPGTLILQTTRPPGDAEPDSRKRVDHSHTSLEQDIANVLDGYFVEQRRGCIELAPMYAVLMRPGYEHLARVQLARQPGYHIQASKAYGPRDMATPEGPARTVAYYLWTPPLWEDGPDLVVAFGPSSTPTFVWSRLLRTRFPHIVASRQRRFVMAELTIAPVPLRPVDGSFADAWHAEIALDVPLPLPDGMRRTAESRLEEVRRELRVRA